MIEAGVLGKPVYTIQTEEFAGSQEQSLHFHYLLAANGGPVEVADDRRQHVRQLADTLTRPEEGAERSRRFIESFVRPLGLDQPGAPLMVDEIERVAKLPKRSRRPPIWQDPARRILLALLKSRAP